MHKKKTKKNMDGYTGIDVCMERTLNYSKLLCFIHRIVMFEGLI